MMSRDDDGDDDDDDGDGFSDDDYHDDDTCRSVQGDEAASTARMETEAAWGIIVITVVMGMKMFCKQWGPLLTGISIIMITMGMRMFSDQWSLKICLGCATTTI